MDQGRELLEIIIKIINESDIQDLKGLVKDTKPLIRITISRNS